MEPTSVSISFTNGSLSEIQGISGIKINENWILTCGIFLSTNPSKSHEIHDFILNLECGVLTSTINNENFSNINVIVTSSAEKNKNNFEIIQNYGKISAAWKCPLLTETFEKLFFGWSFDQNSMKTNKHLLKIFLLINLNDDKLNEVIERKLLEDAEQSLNHLLNKSEELENLGRGKHVLIESTPFGNSIFINSISRGIVSNVFGINNCLMLTDANAVPGSEGGSVYIKKNDGNKILCGMVIAPLSWCRGEWVDYTFAARLLPCLRRLLNEQEHIDSIAKVPTEENTWITELLDKSIVLVRCGSEWGSGIVLDTGTILTCSHVVNEAPERRIRIVFHNDDNRKSSIMSNVWAKLVYRTPRGQPYDVAILSIDNSVMETMLRPLKIASRDAEEGEIIISAGFPFFSSPFPTITRGNISKVTKSMLQTTCCVQSGASGGPIVRIPTGELLGMVVCNVITTRTLYPRLNMAIPITTIKEPIMNYVRTGNVDALSVLTNHDEGIRDVWNFHLPSKI